MEDKIILCKQGEKDAFKKGIDGFAYTFNKNEKSRRKAYQNAIRSHSSKHSVNTQSNARELRG
jgi:hypothetical protein